jgi:Tfp pilus assembly protein PilF
VFTGKFWIGLAFLLSLGGTARAQWNSNPMGNTRDCKEIALLVEDSTGAGITGATVVPEDSPIPVNTDANGVAHLPCRVAGEFMPRVSVTAQGYKSVTTTLVPDSGPRYAVRLDRADYINRSAGATINVSELSRDNQKKSIHLQEEAAKALVAKNYDSAEVLLTEAKKLTPSAAAILNNLGIVAMHRKDLDAAGEYFKKASESAPRSGEIKGNLGLVLWMLNRQDESYSTLVKASMLGYESNAANYIMGVVGLQKGECKESVKLLKKVPTDQFPYRDLYLSIALRGCGENKAADESYQNFRQRNPAPFSMTSLQ